MHAFFTAPIGNSRSLTFCTSLAMIDSPIERASENDGAFAPRGRLAALANRLSIIVHLFPSH
jgi:hypothetical protein